MLLPSRGALRVRCLVSCSASVADGAGVECGEEVVAFVIDEDEGWEILDRDFPDCLHAEFGEGDDFL